MASLKDLRRRIRSTKSMQQIFKAMEMVAAAKLRRAQARAQASAPYSVKISEMLGNLAAAAEDLDHQVFKVREAKKTVIVLITSDRGTRAPTTRTSASGRAAAAHIDSGLARRHRGGPQGP
jgi:F-type H+-transporting ATPase subunit gamma